MNSIKVLVDKDFPKLEELKIEANENLDYKDKKIQELYEKYKIDYTFNSIL